MHRRSLAPAPQFLFELSDPATINHLVVFLTGTPFPQGYAATVYFLWPSPGNATWTLLGHLSNEKPSAIFRLGGKKAPLQPGKSMDTLMDDASGDAAPFAMGTGGPTAAAQLGISIEPVESVMAQIATLPAGAHALGGAAAAGTPGAAAADSGMVVTRANSFSDPSSVATKLLENLYNYCTSFAGPIPMGGSALFGANWGNAFIPLKVRVGTAADAANAARSQREAESGRRRLTMSTALGWADGLWGHQALQDWYNNTQRKIRADPSFLR
ncbi:hypothetical protein HK105_203727 [Polyrhizophydium stewartii]|uniref:Hikeshi-like N-terminal domain-containing protein n=1 Tax=Polyrhizophydium stewartii TaxID=2732419 RepID=A0ABR4NAQ6_9FUNG